MVRSRLILGTESQPEIPASNVIKEHDVLFTEHDELESSGIAVGPRENFYILVIVDVQEIENTKLN